MKKLIYFFLLIAIAVISSCRKDESDNTSTPGNSSSTQINATISGRVLDESGSGLQGVNVTAYGITANTDANGIFLIQGSVAKNRCVLEFNKPGYMKRLHAIIPSSANVNYVKIILLNEPASQSFQSMNGGSVTLDHGGSVSFAPNSFVVRGTTNTYNGLVTFETKHISPDNSNFSMLIPGGDLSGVDANQKNISLYSYGMASVSITGSGGESLQLASGTTATITFPIAASQTSTAPQSIPLWYLDETDALWKEDGQATRVGNNYVGDVSHFTWWNCDLGLGRATIIGRVVDCEGTPLANVVVTVNGQRTLVTDQDGYYTNWVPAGLALTFVVLPQGVIVLPSQTENVAPLTDGQTFTVPDLEVPCGARINGHLTDCNGEPIEASLALMDNNTVVNYQFSNDGTFSIIGLPNTSYVLSIFSSSGSVSQNVTYPAAEMITDIGTVQLCNNVIGGSNSYFINGDGFNNLLINLTNYLNNSAEYSGILTSCVASGYSVLGNNCSITLIFDGNQPLNQNLADSSGGFTYFSLSLPNNCYQPHLGGLPFILNVTEYGNVGDSVKGTFYGNLYSCQGSTPVYVSNGKFAFLRTQ